MKRTCGILILLAVLLHGCGTPAVAYKADPKFGDLLIAAEQAEGEGQFLEAARKYHSAYELRLTRTDLIYRAAELYIRARDYETAAFAYSLVPEGGDDQPLLGLRYGRALKQAGQRVQAKQVLQDFKARYTGADRRIVGELVDDELLGLNHDGFAPGDTRYAATRLGAGINSGGDETGPSPLGATRLLFASARGDQFSILETQLVGTDWRRATPPGGFPIISGGRFGTGTFSDDGQTYFFTICNGNATTRCEVFRTGLRLSGGWRTPMRLGSSVNAPGANNAYPSAVTLEDGRQVLYFASNRNGGLGGLDIYRATQTSVQDPTDFGEAVLLGTTINTYGDESTPVFDRERQVLQFASTGHPGLGGYDTFRAQRADGVYGQPQNLGAPINSPADDRGMTLPSGAGVAFLSSNRIAPGKPTTTDDDLYLISTGVSTPVLRATVFDAADRSALGGVEIILLQMLPDKQEREVMRTTFPSAAYQATLEPATTYKVVLKREGYERSDYRVVTDADGYAVYGRPIYLRPRGYVAGAPPPGSVAGGGGSQTSLLDPDSAPADSQKPTAYRIQIAAARAFDANEDRFARVKDIGQLRSERVPGRNLQRITVGYYGGLDEAKAALKRVKKAGFEEAFVVRYDYGERYGPIW